MSAPLIDYYFWASSDWTYLGDRRFLDLAAQHGATVRYRPMRMAPLFEATGGTPLRSRAKARQAWRETELRRWMARLDMPLIMTPRHFPVDNERALRLMAGADAAGHDIGALVERIMKALWIEDCDLADAEVLIGIAGHCGLSPDDARAHLTSDTAAAILTRNTRDAIAVDVFGTQSYVLDQELFWGQDRLSILADALADQSARSSGWFGQLPGIFTAESACVEMESLPEVEMLPGIGVKGDRYATASGCYSGKPHADRQVTLFEDPTSTCRTDLVASTSMMIP